MVSNITTILKSMDRIIKVYFLFDPEQKKSNGQLKGGYPLGH